jgi:hypothetical protein
MDLDEIERHLVEGTIPPTVEMQKVCGFVAVLYTAYTIRADADGQPVSFHLIAKRTKEGKPLFDVHSVWTALSIHKIMASADDITDGFKGVDIVKASPDIDVYIAYKSLLSFECNWCKQAFHADINRKRCEAAHTSRKKLAATELNVGTIVDYWDGLDAMQRRSIASKTMKYLVGIPVDANFSPEIQRIVRLASGNVDITGDELIEALEQASEGTAVYRLARPVKKAAMYTRGDYVAAMASVTVDALAKAQSDAAANALLDVEKAEAEAEAQEEARKKQRREQRKLKNFEKNFWKAPVSTVKWADEIDYD